MNVVCEVCRVPVVRGRCDTHPLAVPIDLDDPAEVSYLVERRRMKLRQGMRGIEAAAQVGTLVSLFAIFPAFALSPTAGVIALLVFLGALLLAAGTWFFGIFQD